MTKSINIKDVKYSVSNLHYPSVRFQVISKIKNALQQTTMELFTICEGQGKTIEEFRNLCVYSFDLFANEHFLFCKPITFLFDAKTGLLVCASVWQVDKQTATEMFSLYARVVVAEIVTVTLEDGTRLMPPFPNLDIHKYEHYENVVADKIKPPIHTFGVLDSACKEAHTIATTLSKKVFTLGFVEP